MKTAIIEARMNCEPPRSDKVLQISVFNSSPIWVSFENLRLHLFSMKVSNKKDVMQKRERVTMHLTSSLEFFGDLPGVITKIVAAIAEDIGITD